MGTSLVRKKWRTSEILRSDRRLRPKAGPADAASVPTLTSLVEDVSSDVCEAAVSVFTSGVLFMIVASLLLIVAEVGVVVLLDLALRNRRRPLTEQRKQRIPSRPVARILAF